MRVRRFRSTGAVVITCLLGSLLGASLNQVEPMSARADANLTVSIVPANSILATPEQGVTYIVTVKNSGTETIRDASISLRLSEQALASIPDASGWFDQTTTLSVGDRIVRQSVGAVAGGETVQSEVVAVVTTDDLGWEWSVYGVDVSVDAEDLPDVRARSALVWGPGGPPRQTNYATVVPLVAPANPASFLSARELETLTGSGGLLSRQLDAASLASAYALDPRIVASILRAAVPETSAASSWLTRMRELNRPSISLQYADADPALQGQAGFPSLLQASFADIPELSQSQAGSAWSPSMPGALWAEPSTLTASSVTSIAATLSTVATPGFLLAGSANLGSPAGPHVALPVSLPGVVAPPSLDVLVMNDAFTSALRAAETASSDQTWRQSVTKASALLAVSAGQDGSFLLGGFSRSLEANRNNYRTSETLSFLQELPWAQQAPLSSALSATLTEAALVESPESTSRIAGAETIFTTHSALLDFASAASPPEPAHSFADRTCLPLLSVAWVGDNHWVDALAALTEESSNYVKDVHFGMTSNINMVGGQAFIPITVVNGHDFDVTVVVRAVPSNPRLTVGDDQVVTISADSQGTVKMPVAARVGNGDTNLLFTVRTASGLQLGDPVTVPVSVRADWEGLGLAIIGVAFVGLISVGTIRTIRRRREVRSRGSDVGRDSVGVS